MDKRVGVGFFYKNGAIGIRAIIIQLDSNNNFRPIWPIDLTWPDNKSGTFWKESKSGRVFYKEV